MKVRLTRKRKHTLKIVLAIVLLVTLFVTITELLKPIKSTVYKEKVIITSSYSVVYKKYNKCIKVRSEKLDKILPIYLTKKEFKAIRDKSIVTIQYTVNNYSYRTDNVTNISVLDI